VKENRIRDVNRSVLTMEIKVIAAGSTKWERFIRRWGVSFLIGEDVLFDTFGDPNVLMKNIRRMHIDLSKVRHIVISHEHWDHISGLWHVIGKCKNATIYICPDFASEIKDRIKSFGVNTIEVKGWFKIKDDVFTIGQICGKCNGESISEQSLVIKSAQGLIIITGCAHPGIDKIIDDVKKMFNEKIYLLIGGLHLKDSNQERIRDVISNLRACGIEKVAPMHCTGAKADKLLKTAYRDNFISVKTGQAVEF
jgi:7,8-dihydropterin-6-yl-methyl-4-(beta-D-ribofuranosyl)aminobenzene 5'-phosphate synthase